MKKLIFILLSSFVLMTALNAQIINLNAGWNLIAINEKPSAASYWPLSTISDNSDISVVYGNGQTYISGASRGNNLIGLEPSKGYWIKSASSTAVSLTDGVELN